MSRRRRGVLWRKCGLPAAMSILLASLALGTAACDIDVFVNSDPSSSGGTEHDAADTTTSNPSVEEPTTESVPSSEPGTSMSSVSTTTSQSVSVMQGEANLGVMLPSEWTRFENTDPHLKYQGEWDTWSDSRASGGNFHWCRTEGASVRIRWEGTRIKVVCLTDQDDGRAEFTLDSQPAVYVDLYSDSKQSRVVWMSGDLSPGYHSLKIEWTGFKNPESLGDEICLDAVDVMGTLAY